MKATRLIPAAITLATCVAIAGAAGTAFASTTEYASSVVSATQGTRADGSAVLPANSSTTNALGAPDGKFYSLGFGGSITLEFPHYVGSNLAISAYEITNGTYPLETATVQVSQNGTTWTNVGTATNQSGSGPNPHTTSFNLPAGTCIRYVRLTDTSNKALFEASANGFDLDAVGATYDATCTPPQPPTPTPGNVNVTLSNVSYVHSDTIAKASTGWNFADGSMGGLGGAGGSASNSGANNSTSTAGNTIMGGNGGTGGAGSAGGTVLTGAANSLSRTVHTINQNLIRIVR